MRAHIISDNVESRIRLAFPGCDILIHQDPAGYEMPATA
jgi:divalent metal cation (Fe/Co/Zn/Cd) transporter